MPIDIPFTMIDNRITRIIENPCGNDWWTMVQLALPAAEDSLNLLVTPQPDEFLEATIEAGRGAKGGKFNRRHQQNEQDSDKGKRRLRRRGFPQIESALLYGLRDAALLKGRKVGTTEWIFSGLHGLAERGAWWWLVYDALDNFFYRWHSSIILSEYCTANAQASVSSVASDVCLLKEQVFNPDAYQLSNIFNVAFPSANIVTTPTVNPCTAVLAATVTNRSEDVYDTGVGFEAKIGAHDVTFSSFDGGPLNPGQTDVRSVQMVDIPCDNITIIGAGGSSTRICWVPSDFHAVWTL